MAEFEVRDGELVPEALHYALGLVGVSGGSGVMIANDVVLTASHCVDPTGNFVTFLGVDRRIERWVRFGDPRLYSEQGTVGPDLALVQLSEPLPLATGFGHPYATPEIGETMAVFGFGQTVPGTNGDGNAYRGYVQVIPSATPSLVEYEPSPGTQNMIMLGDSGGPSFVLRDQTYLVGIHSRSNDVSLGIDVAVMPYIWGLFSALEPAWTPGRLNQVFDVFGAEIRAIEEPAYNLDLAPWYDIARIGNELCSNRMGFAGGHYNGHQQNDRFGLACSNGTVYAVEVDDMNRGDWALRSPEEVTWAHATRRALEMCRERDSAGGLFNGKRTADGKWELLCPVGAHFDATGAELASTGWPIGAVDTVGFAQALRAAHGYCTSRGFATGFLDGNQDAEHYGVVCQRRNPPPTN